MDYHLEQHRDFLTPAVYSCLHILLQQIQQFNDENTFNKIAMREQVDNPFVKKTHLKLNYFIKKYK